MSVLSTVHSHCTYCDGKNTPVEMAEAAYKLGFISYGFSSHSHLPYRNGYAMKMQREALYRSEITDLKKQYAGKMEILLGLELDGDSYMPDFKYDYLISSVHQLHIGGKVFPVDQSKAVFEECIKEFGGIKNVIKIFYHETLKAAKRDNIDIIGHLDLITKFNEQGDLFDPNDEGYLSIVKNTVDEIVKAKPNIIFEVNTGAMARGYRSEPYPALPILKHIAKSGAKVIINSDTHNKDSIDFGFDKATQHCKAAGINKVLRLRQNSFEEIEI